MAVVDDMAPVLGNFRVKKLKTTHCCAGRGRDLSLVEWAGHSFRRIELSAQP